MRIALIGCSYHWGAINDLLQALPEARIVAVAPGCAAESLDGFGKAQGVTAQTRRCADPRVMLDETRPDLVQISTGFEAMGRWAIESAQRRIPIASEKPIALDEETLAELWEAVQPNAVPLYAMQGMQGVRPFHAAWEAVRLGKIGIPYASYHQKSYRWNTRPAAWKDRRTFPGLVPWVGIHALAWMHWILGDVFTEVAGWEGGALHPETPACATQAGLLFRQRNGGFASLSLDYLRPPSAPTHGDERLRIAGSNGVVEVVAVEGRCTLIAGPEGARVLEPQGEVADPYLQFARSLRGECAPPLQVEDVFRITELALRAQRAAETGMPVSLLPTRYQG